MRCIRNVLLLDVVFVFICLCRCVVSVVVLCVLCSRFIIGCLDVLCSMVFSIVWCVVVFVGSGMRYGEIVSKLLLLYIFLYNMMVLLCLIVGIWLCNVGVKFMLSSRC